MMKENSEEANDSFSASSTSTLFDLPENILRNLTPIKKSNFKEKKHRIRKQQIIQTKTHKLKKRSEIINRKIESLKINQEILSNRIAKNLSENLRLANERRMAFLEKKRERARRVQFTKLRLPIALSSPLKVTTIEENCVENVSKDVRSVIIIQRNIKKHLLLLNVNYFKQLHLLSKVQNMSYTETLQLLNSLTEFTKITISVLRNLGMPDILPNQKYKSFFYSLILVADYKDSLIEHIHSGFNTNIADKNMNNLVNSISLLLFKLAKLVLERFIEFINCDERDIIHPWSIPKLKFCKSWRIYHFLFQIFRTMHFDNCVVIINDALGIVQNQLRVCSNPEINIQRENYVKNQRFLAKISQVFQFSGTEWAYFGQDSSKFINNIKSQVFNRLVPERPKVSASLEVFHQLNNVVNSPSNHIISFNQFTFAVPPKISIYDWRKYWIRQYSRQENKIENNQYGIPNKLKSGFFNSLNLTNSLNIYVEDIFRDLDIKSIHDKYDSLLQEINLREFIIEFDIIVCDSFLLLFEYCINFNDYQNSEGYEIAMSQYTKLKNSYQVSNYNNQKELLQYFKLHFFCLSHLASLGPFVLNFVPNSCSNFIDKIQSIENASIDSFEDFVIFYKELEILIMNLWLRKCKFDNIESIKQFENVCQFISNKNYKIENGTNSPHLRFPLFYNYLMKYGTDFDKHIILYRSIIKSYFEYPNLETFTRIEPSFKYFQNVFINYVLKVISYPKEQQYDALNNEFYEFFREDTKAVVRKCNLIFLSNCVLNLILNYYSSTETNIHGNLGEAFNGTTIQRCTEILMDYFTHSKDQDIAEVIFRLHGTDFNGGSLNLGIEHLIVYVRREYAKILEGNNYSLLKTTLLAKFEKLLKVNSSSLEFQYLLRGNFRHFTTQTMLAISELNEITNEIYGLYSPLLNWIYKDIGEPVI